jgi:hypothetical protein
MAGFLGKAPLTSDIGLILEIAVTVALIVGRFAYARKGRLRAHGFAVTIAVILHCVSVPLIMIPSFLGSLNALLTNLSSPAIIITWIHMPIGLAVLFLAIYLVVSWRFREVNATCYKRSGLMRPLWMLWIFSLFLGYLLYLSIAFFS